MIRTARTVSFRPALWRAAWIALVAAPAPAFAHLGHVAEVAGHSHWIGLAAAAGAAALAAWVAGAKSDDAAPEADEAQGDSDAPIGDGEKADA